MIRDIPPELLRAIKIRAAQEGKTMRVLILQALERGIKPLYTYTPNDGEK
jgi:plasmid stability protein